MPDLGIPAMRHGFEAKVVLFRMEQVPCFDSKPLGRYGHQREVGGMAKPENPTQGLVSQNSVLFSQKCYGRVHLMLPDVTQPVVIGRSLFDNIVVNVVYRTCDTYGRTIDYKS